MTRLVQLNLSVDDELAKKVKKLALDNGWSQREMVTRAINTFGTLMDLHEEIAGRVEPDIGELYRRLARENPVKLVEPKRSTELGWTDQTREQPAAKIDGWLVSADPETNELIAFDEHGRRGRYVGGDVHAWAPSPDEALLDPVAD
jgi:hypothetical protein